MRAQNLSCVVTNEMGPILCEMTLHMLASILSSMKCPDLIDIDVTFYKLLIVPCVSDTGYPCPGCRTDGRKHLARARKARTFNHDGISNVIFHKVGDDM